MTINFDDFKDIVPNPEHYQDEYIDPVLLKQYVEIISKEIYEMAPDRLDREKFGELEYKGIKGYYYFYEVPIEVESLPIEYIDIIIEIFDHFGWDIFDIHYTVHRNKYCYLAKLYPRSLQIERKLSKEA